MQHGLRTHAKYSASSAHRWMLCPGSVREAEAAPPEIESEYAKDGTEAHELLEFALKNGYWNAQEASIMADRRDDTARCDAVQVALDYVYNLMDAYEDAVLLTEEELPFPTKVHGDVGGHCDIMVYVPSLQLLYVIDYKHGVEVVEIEENKQTLFYATSAWHRWQEGYPIGTVVPVVIQPNAFHPEGWIRERVIPVERLQHFITEVEIAIMASEAEDAPLVPGPAQCRWCPARFTCRAREAQALAVVSPGFENVKMITQSKLPDPKELPLDRIAYILQAKSLLTDWLNDVESVASDYAKNGVNVPGFKLVEAQARRKWYGKDEEIAQSLASLAKVDVDRVFPRQLVGVTEAEKLVKEAFKANAPRGKKKIAAEDAVKAMAALTLKQSSGNLVLVPIEDKRPAANLAQTAFNGVQVLPPDT